MVLAVVLAVVVVVLIQELIYLAVEGLSSGVLAVVGARVVVVVVVVVGWGFIVEVVTEVDFVFLLFLIFLVFCVFDVSFSALRFHHFLFSLGVSISLFSFASPDRRINPKPSKSTSFSCS